MCKINSTKNTKFADPDDPMILWLGNKSSLFKIGAIDNISGASPVIMNQWHVNLYSYVKSVNTIIKVGDLIVIQNSTDILMLTENGFKYIGTVEVSQEPGVNICTDGTTLYSSNGTYYIPSTKTWKSFIGDGKNLSKADAEKLEELKAYLSIGAIGAIQGSANGMIYCLTPTHLIEIQPML